MSDVDEEEFMCGDDEEYDLVNYNYAVIYFLQCVVHGYVMQIVAGD